MPSPTSALTTPRSDLAASLVEFDLAMDRNGFVAQRVAPIVEVQAKAGVYKTIPLAQLLQTRDTLRAPGSGFSRSKYTFTPGSYACENNGAEEAIDDDERAQYSDLQAELYATLRAYDAVMRNYEIRVANLLFNATTWTGADLTTAVGTEWSTAATATPVANVNAACKKVWDGSGLWPNVLIINRIVFNNLRNCAEVRDRLASSGAGQSIAQGNISEAQLAQVFDLDEVIVAGVGKNTAKEGQTVTVAPVWDSEYAMVAVVSRSGDVQRPSVARTFHWSGNGSSPGGTVEVYRDEPVMSDVVRVRMDSVEKVLYTKAAHLLSNITA